jgi:uncharacterized protein YgiB involved in biofilm formation
MKRSRTVALVAMGAGTLALSACGESIDTAAYESFKQCRSGGVYAEEFCRTEYDRASRLHRDVAPRYASREDCEADFGPGDRCEPSGGGGGYVYSGGGSGGRYVRADGTPYSGPYSPRMQGYMVSGKGKSSAIQAQPLYRGWDAKAAKPTEFRTADNAEVASSPGRTKVNSRSVSPKPAVQTSTISRGGFGRAGSFGL